MIYNGLAKPSVTGLNLLILVKVLMPVILSKFGSIPVFCNCGYTWLNVNFYVGFSLFQGGLNKVFRKDDQFHVEI